ncbi:MAG: alpha/beta fold hydrolase [Leptospirales bacterium]|jgi:pimeloyl-ACP methyl ester carboxylesterase
MGIKKKRDRLETECGSNSAYWRRYYPADLADWMAEHARSEVIESAGISLNVDLYERPETGAPVFIFNHGGGGYARMFGVLVRELYGRGYTVALPDQRGQGYSKGDRGDFVISELERNICDAFAYLRRRFAGPVILAGGSFGGALTYMAAARLARSACNDGSTTVGNAVPDAVICHNLYDLGRPRDALGLSRLYRLRDLPGFAAANQSVLRVLARVAPRLCLPFRLLGDFRAMIDARDGGFYAIWKRDPIPLRRVSLRYLSSVGSSPPAIPLEMNALPVLVINPTRDRMTPPAITRANFEHLGGPKEYREIPYGHWSVSAAFAREWCDLVDEFVRSQRLDQQYLLEGESDT